MPDAWTKEGETPVHRLMCFAEMLIRNRDDIQRYGCPVGTLCGELSKLEHTALGEATMLFTQFRRWLTKQFAQLGFENHADELAMHLLSRSQGIASLANAFQDEDFMRREVHLIEAWLMSLRAGAPPRRKKSASRVHEASRR